MDFDAQMGVRRFGRINWLGLWTLAERESRRFFAVWTQTILAPLVTAGLFMSVFTVAIGTRRGEVMGVDFATFIAPGILMMMVIQNAFANTSSSLTISKVQGNIVDTLMPPLSPLELVLGYLAGAAVRGLVVALIIGAAMYALSLRAPVSIAWTLVFVLVGAVLMGGLGILAGIYSEKFDQMAAITNFVVTPLSFLSGTFYSIESLPDGLREVSRFNPIYYLIDGVRHGMIGVSDTSPWLGLAVSGSVSLAVLAVAWAMFARGYRLKA